MMKFLAILIALGLEQWRIASWRRASENLYVQFLRKLEVFLAPGRNTWLVTIAALLPILVVALIDYLSSAAWWLSLIWDVLLLYFVMGFRHFSHACAEITESLKDGDVMAARAALYKWQGGDTSMMTSDEIAQRSIEGGIIAAYRNVFGVFFWFCILGGWGAAAYWMLNLMAREWAQPVAGLNVSTLSEERGKLGRAARWLLFLADWIPIRVLAATFAIVGNFEDAVYQWRALPDEYALFDNTANENVLLATAMGALGVTWNPSMRAVPASVNGVEIHEEAMFGDESESGEPREDGASQPAEESAPTETPVAPDATAYGSKEDKVDLGAPPVGQPISPAALQPAIGMVWRALIFWLAIVALFAVSGLWHGITR